MRKLFACILVGGSLALPALAQETSNDAPPPGSTIVIPEDQRGGLVGVETGAHLVVTLDDQFRIATIKSGPPPDEADFDPSKLSRTEETLVRLGTIGMWAPAGALAFTLLPVGDQTNLKVSNNTTDAVAYIAALFRGDPKDGNFELTTTCTVPAGQVVVESWPYKVDGIFIVRMLLPPEPDAKWCVDPTRDRENPDWYSLDQR